MSKYLAIFNSSWGMERTEISAESAKDAKEQAFRWMCGKCGDRIHTVRVFKEVEGVECENELNPYPYGAMAEVAERDYKTGKRIRRH